MAIEAVISELNRLVAEGLIGDYAVGGAVGAQAYLEAMSTEDVDVFVILTGAAATSLAPLSPIYANLIAHGAKESGPYLVIGGWPVQFLSLTGALYDDAIKCARSVSIGTEIGRVMSPEHLAAIALETGRSKDKLRLIEFVNKNTLDMTVFDDLTSRFGLAEKWALFQSQFLTTK